MLQLKNQSPFKPMITVLPDKEGVDTLLVIVKGTFLLGDKVTVHGEQQAVAPADKHFDDPAATSIKIPSDVCLPKPGADVILQGHAYAPGGQAGQVDVTLRIGSGVKTVRVIGDRTWSSGLFGSKASPPAAFDKIPLMWERAFGGMDAHPQKPEEKKGEERNPIGRGFRHFRAPADGTPLPNLERPEALIKSWKDHPEPAGFGPVSAAWLPRRGFAGTYDQAWQDGRAPYLPLDFDPRFFQIAPPDQILPALAGGEAIEVLNASANGRLAFALPKYRVEARVRMSDALEQPPMALDTVLIQPDDKRLILVWRGVLRCDKKALKVREVHVVATQG